MTADFREFGSKVHQWGANVAAIKVKTKQPLHPWQQWQYKRQSEQELADLPWSRAVALGIINGSGFFRCVDIDAPKDEQGRPLYKVPESVLIMVLRAMGLPDDYQWSYASGSGAGWGVVIRCQEALPPDWMSDKGIYIGLPIGGLQFDHIEFRWSSGQTVIEGEHPTGPGYEWRLGERPFVPPAMVSAEQVIAGFEAVAVLKSVPTKESDFVPSENGKSAYGLGALNDAIRQVSTTQPGNRNNALFQQTASLIELANGGELTPYEVERGMRGAGLAAELPEGEVLATIASAVKHVGNKARTAHQGETAVLPSVNGSQAEKKTAVGGEMPPLPASAAIDPALGVDACQWLDECVTFLRRVSPRSYEGFYAAVALWLLSTIAARRVTLVWGMKSFFTNLYISLCATTTLFAKSTVAQRGQEILQAAGLGHLLAPNEFTPQAFINYLSGQLPANYGELSPEAQERIRKRLAFAAQIGWFIEEWGSMIQAMMRDSGVMSYFRSHLRVFDDNPPAYEYMAIKRQDVVKRPYLAMLGNMTPADIQPYAKPGAALWRDGFYARCAFITPPSDEKPKNGRFPTKQIAIPAAIIEPLQAWHERLGIPQVRIEERRDEKGEATGKYDIYRNDPLPESCTCGAGVSDAYYAYLDGLIEVAQEQAEMGQTDLLGNYGRLPEKAMRIAMLLASLSNNGRIELCHWARAQSITEEWRASLHNLAGQMSVLTPSEDSKRQEQIVRYLHKHGASTAAQISRNVRHMGSAEIDTFCKQLVKVEVLAIVEHTQKGTNVYDLMAR